MLRPALLASGVLLLAWHVAPAAGEDSPATQPATQPAPPAATQPATMPVVEREASRTPWKLHLDELTFELGAEARYDRRRTKQATADWFRRYWRETDRASGFEETIGARTSGWLFDERMLTFDLAGRWGLSQESFHETGPRYDRSERPDGDLLEYDLNFTLFPRGTLSANVFASQQDSRVPRAFLPSLDRTYERYGVDLIFSHATLPMRLTFEHVRDELAGRTDHLRDDEQRGRDTLRYEGTWFLSERQALRWEYQYDDRREQYSGTSTRFDSTRNYLVLNHTLRFGADDRSLIETLARFQDESGDLARDIAEVSTRLRLQHTDSLSTHYRLQYLREGLDNYSTDTLRGEAGLTHQWSEALLSTFEIYALQQNTDDGTDFSEWGGLANLSFSKANRLGQFSAHLSYHHSQTDTQHNNQRGVVLNEAVTFRDPLPSYLDKPDVETLSIVVTDSTRSRTYLPGRDYLIVKLGRYIALERLQTGRIANQETVLVAYSYRVAKDYDITRDRVDFRIQQAFDFGLTPYYAASFQDESTDISRYLAFRERDVQRHRLGAMYRRRLWSAGLEYEYNDDSIDPYQAVHANGDWVVYQDDRHQVDLQGAFSYFWFDGTRYLETRETLLFDGGVSYRYLLARNLEASATALYRYEDDSFYGVTHGIDVSGGVDWRIGLFALRFEVEYDRLRLPGSIDDNVGVWLKLRREIPTIARGRR